MTELVVIMLALPVLTAAGAAVLPAGALTPLNRVTAVATLALAGVVVGSVLADVDNPLRDGLIVVDPVGALLLAIVAGVGALSALASGLALAAADTETGRRRAYLAAFHLFWAALLAVVVADNLAVAWLLIEATTAASALLVAFSGRPRALEAGWKYLVLTTLGLVVALLGIMVLYTASGADHGLSSLDWPAIREAAAAMDGQQALLAGALILVGFAAKIGWAPVHNWLPDAHSEAPPAISALLSAALLPTVLLVAWRAQAAIGPEAHGRALFIAFGLTSLAVAVPFLWRELPIKRLLAYSSLEHMGVLAVGVGVGTPLALAGVTVHVAGHAIAKALGFYATIPLLRADPALASRPARALGEGSPRAAGALGVALLALSGLPPSPLFVSELLILLGAFEAHLPAVAIVTSLLLSLGFLGIVHALSEILFGDREHAPSTRAGGTRLTVLTGAAAVALLALTVGACVLPGAHVLDVLMGAIA